MPYTYSGWVVDPNATKVDLNNSNKAPMIVMWQYALANYGTTPSIPSDIATFAASLDTTVATVQKVVDFVNDDRNTEVQTEAGRALADLQTMSYGGGNSTNCKAGQSLPPLAAAAANTWKNGTQSA